jgi:ribosomal protein L1
LLPEGMGKIVKVAVYANENLFEKAKNVGADMFVDKELLANVNSF